MQEWWQHLPEHIDPIAITIGFFSLRWYALLWLVGFLGAVLSALWLRRWEYSYLSRSDIWDLYLSLFLGALIGGRLGYAILYRPGVFWSAPWRIMWPYDSTGLYTGIAGMSFHGGLVGVTIGLVLFARKRGFDIFRLADLIALSAPVALFFGRLGNFMNEELVGRVTALPWGMYFPFVSPVGILRHPSVLYEAFGEGIILFLMFFLTRGRFAPPGVVASLFLIGYGTIRFLLEYVREPDQGVSLFLGGLTRGQSYSLPLIIIGCGLLVWLYRRRHAIIVTD